MILLIKPILMAFATSDSVKKYLEENCTPKDKKYPWQEQEYECPLKPTNDK